MCSHVIPSWIENELPSVYTYRSCRDEQCNTGATTGGRSILTRSIASVNRRIGTGVQVRRGCTATYTLEENFSINPSYAYVQLLRARNGWACIWQRE